MRGEGSAPTPHAGGGRGGGGRERGPGPQPAFRRSAQQKKLDASTGVQEPPSTVRFKIAEFRCKALKIFFCFFISVVDRISKWAKKVKLGSTLLFN